MADSRKIRKPLMEKKRRARINESLEILKNILIEYDPDTISRTGQKASKLEKADILEMTVNYLQKMTACHRQQYPAYRAKPYASAHFYQHQHHQHGQLRTAAEQYQMFPYPSQPNRRTILDPSRYVPNLEMVSPPTSPDTVYHETPKENYRSQDNGFVSAKDIVKKEDICEPMWRPW
ncbi:enhancer of split mgamma protein-like [Anthonomus grandis grandis]|uniref:enhancer of split mgamma protein-like n=1 Tax=Anthonomus grandis grandis TaxID=2921223 RepID=UPI0021668A5A|nr:enhancer of split mgamma protein-like [Anthonomus grandis grandis]